MNHHTPQIVLVSLVLPAFAPVQASSPTAPATLLPAVGNRVDLVPFGVTTTDARSVTVEWENPRDVHEVRISAASLKPEDVDKVHIEYWGSIWPANGTGGWMRLDDPWNGEWVRPAVKPQPDPQSQATWVFQFPPLTKAEWKSSLDDKNQSAPTFRRALKIRVVTDDSSLPGTMTVSALGQSHWRQAEFDIHLRGLSAGREPHTTAAYTVEITNGHLVTLDLFPGTLSTTKREAEALSFLGTPVPGSVSGGRIKVLYAETDRDDSADRTRITVRLGGAGSPGFSFVPQDVLRDGVMRIPDLGALICESSTGITPANDPGPAGRYWQRPVRTRLTERPEMTRQMAMAGIPRLQPAPWVPLGVPSARQEFFVSANGDWSVWGLSLNTDNGRDAQRWPFQKTFGNERLPDRLDFLLDTSEQPRFKGNDREGAVRYLEDGHLPLIHAEWQTGPIHYHHQLAATVLIGDYGDDVTRKGDETVVLLGKLTVTNNDSSPQTAKLHLRYSLNVPIAVDESGLVKLLPREGFTVPDGLIATRGILGRASWTVQPSTDEKSPAVLAAQIPLKAGESRSLYFKTPFVELLDASEFERLKSIDFDIEVPKVLDYWRKRLDRGMVIDVPDKAVNDFYKANLWHNVITTDRDPVTGLYNQGVGTVTYRVFANETVMIARSMDMRGEHVEAQRFIEPMLHYQGSEALKGRFSTQEGAFHGAGQYTHGEYAMNHGFVLWGIGDHYFMTRDRAYLERVAPQVVKGCEFLISERASTFTPSGKPRLPYHGLAPASSLEDVVEYQYWFATNAYFYLGMKRAAQALSHIRHPAAKRLAEEAEKYRRDIEAAMREATTRAAAVQRRDGYWIPYVPSRVYHWKHLTEGWIREALYPALHLASAEVVSPNDPLMTWMLDDLEDNIFFSWQSGYNVEDYEKTWFERGAVTLQPCLVDTPTLYMARNEPQASLRSFWNTYALSIHPDTACFAEWARRFGQPGGPLYKTSDESRWVMWLRQFLIWEDGDILWFGRGLPREWLQDGKSVRIERAKTIFGTASMVIQSNSDQGLIRVTLELPTRQTPKETWLRLRHPAGKRPHKVFIEGTQLPDESILGEDIRIPPAGNQTIQPGRPIHIQAHYSAR